MTGKIGIIMKISKFLLRLKTFIKALIFHIYAGSPKCSKKQILERFQICKSCDKYNATLSQCDVCGCNINDKKIFMNKLAWADQECPIGKWNKCRD